MLAVIADECTGPRSFGRPRGPCLQLSSALPSSEGASGVAGSTLRVAAPVNGRPSAGKKVNYNPCVNLQAGQDVETVRYIFNFLQEICSIVCEV